MLVTESVKRSIASVPRGEPFSCLNLESPWFLNQKHRTQYDQFWCLKAGRITDQNSPLHTGIFSRLALLLIEVRFFKRHLLNIPRTKYSFLPFTLLSKKYPRFHLNIFSAAATPGLLGFSRIIANPSFCSAGWSDSDLCCCRCCRRRAQPPTCDDCKSLCLAGYRLGASSSRYRSGRAWAPGCKRPVVLCLFGGPLSWDFACIDAFWSSGGTAITALGSELWVSRFGRFGCLRDAEILRRGKCTSS